MAQYKVAFDLTSRVEGGYVNDPKDNGGETYRGIARKSNLLWAGWKLIDSFKKQSTFPRNLIGNIQLNTLVESFYKENYWNPIQLDGILDQRIANELYDTAVNMGVGTACMFFQKSLNILTNANLSIDGKIGIQTINVYKTLSSSDNNSLLKLLNILQGEKYINICVANPSQKKFIRGWLTRVFEV